LPRRSFSGWRRCPWHTAWRRKSCRAMPACALPAFRPDGRGCRSFAVDLVGVLQHRGGRHPVAVFELLEKAGASACMTGDTAQLFNFQQHHVVVTVDPDFADVLHVAGFLALAPQTIPG